MKKLGIKLEKGNKWIHVMYNETWEQENLCEIRVDGVRIDFNVDIEEIIEIDSFEALP